MDWNWFLFRFEGRINRAKYWLATLIIVGWMILALSLLAGISAAFGIRGHGFAIDLFGISASINLGDDASASTASWFPWLVTIPMTAAFAWCYAAASIKRLHDRNRSGWWMVPFVVAPGLFGHFEEVLERIRVEPFIRKTISVMVLSHLLPESPEAGATHAAPQ